MPRLPTILVIGSQAISTMPVSSAVVMALLPVRRAAAGVPLGWVRRAAAKLPPSSWSPGLQIAGEKLVALLAPLGLLVRGPGGEAAKGADDGAVHGARGRGDPGTGRLVHERHELVGETRHGAGDADTADVRAAPHAVDPAALGHVTFDHRPPAPQPDQALGRAVLPGEVAPLGVA